MIIMRQLLLNTPKYKEGYLRANYDKLLHLCGSFTALVWLCKFLPRWIGFSIVFFLCISKTIWNFSKCGKYNPLGDWLANTLGFILWYMF